MITECPHCQKKLKLSPKVESGLRMLSPGKSLRINCPQCGGEILLNAAMLTREAPPGTTASIPPRSARQQVTPPPPPDLSGLKTSSLEGKEMVEDIPQALILMPADSPDSRPVTEALEALGYQPSFVQSAEEAMEKMQFVTYASVILHSHYESSTLEKGVFHRFMQAMPMNKRRYIFYMLIGPEFHTLYDLQALACSANLVVNSKDLSQLTLILRKAIPQYEALFGAIMQEMHTLSR